MIDKLLTTLFACSVHKLSEAHQHPHHPCLCISTIRPLQERNPLRSSDDGSDRGGRGVSPKDGSGGGGGASPAIGGAGGGRGGGGGGGGAPGGANMGGTERSVDISSHLQRSQNSVCPPAPLHCYITSHHFTPERSGVGGALWRGAALIRTHFFVV